MKRELVLATTGPDDTRRVAATVAGALRPGDVVSLTGELGAGKTCFVQGAAAALGVTARVTSPTFLLRREYEGQVPIVHLDVYRLETLQEAAELGLDDAEGRVTFIEWGDAMQPLLPADHLEVEFRATSTALGAPPRPDTPAGAASPPDTDAPPEPAVDDGAAPRRIVLRPRGADWHRRIVGLAVDAGPWRVDGGPSNLDALEL